MKQNRRVSRGILGAFNTILREPRSARQEILVQLLLSAYPPVPSYLFDAPSNQDFQKDHITKVLALNKLMRLPRSGRRMAQKADDSVSRPSLLITDTSGQPNSLIDSSKVPGLVDDEILLPEMERAELRRSRSYQPARPQVNSWIS